MGSRTDWMVIQLLSVVLLAMVSVPSAGQPFAVFEGEGIDEPVELRDVGAKDTLYPVQIHGRWGYMNQHGHLVIVPQFDWADYFYEGQARAVVDGRTGFIRGNGTWLIEPQYVYADRFSEGFAVVGDGSHFGFIDKAGKLRVPIQLQGALRFKEETAGVIVDGLCGFINARGRLGNERFLRVRSFHDGLAMVQLTADGERGPLAYVNRGENVRWLDRRGVFTDLGDFHEGLARARIEDRWGYIDKTFRFRIDPQFDAARDFTDGLAAVQRAGKWGYINKKGDFQVQPRFDLADDFDDALALVKLGTQFGFVDRVAKHGIEAQFDDAEPFFRNYARVSDGTDFGYLGSTGRLVWDPRRVFRHGIVDVRATETARIAIDDDTFYHRKVKPPPARVVMPSPYTPEHLYEESLP